MPAGDLSPDQHVSLTTRLQQKLDARGEHTLHTFQVVPNELGSNGTALAIKLDTSATNEQPRAKLQAWDAVLDVRHDLQAGDAIERIAGLLAEEVSAVFDDESLSLAYLLHESPFSSSNAPLPSPDARAKLDGRTTRAFKYAPTYHLTFSLFTPSASPSAWEIDEALNRTIAKLLSPLSAISKFTINTQVQLYASFSPSIVGPIHDETHDKWTLRREDLSGFINAAEWPLNPSIGSGPTINFVLYVSPSDKSPLSIENSAGTSWIIPQWGGVQIHNSNGNTTDRLLAADLENDMLIFTEQLASLLGVPQTPPSLSLRIQSLARERATALILSASSTLGALARLTLKLTSIAIPDSVAASVDETVQRLEEACRNLNDGRYEQALESARIAESEAEKAFFEPSMVGQVYFPEEHKVAVYVPLLGPMAVPLFMSGLKELKKLRQRKVKSA